MVFSVLASIPSLTLLTFCLLFEYRWAWAGVLKIFSLSGNNYSRAHHYICMSMHLGLFFPLCISLHLLRLKFICHFISQYYETVLQVLTGSFNLIIWNKLSESLINISESGRWLQNHKILRKNVWQFLFTFILLDPLRWLFAYFYPPVKWTKTMLKKPESW